MRARSQVSQAEKQYARVISNLTVSVGKLTEQVHPEELHKIVDSYSTALRPWATKVATRMILEVNKRDKAAWRALGSTVSSQLHSDLRRVDVNGKLEDLVKQQVALILDLPRRIVERAEDQLDPVRSARTSAKLMASLSVSSASTELTRVRATAVGSDHYIWRTARDSKVRPGHARMEGKVCEWANPPAVQEDAQIVHHHPGEIWNCRCYPEIIVSDPYTPIIRGRRR